MKSKYVDNTAIMQVIGCVYTQPSLLEQDEIYQITELDFPDNFHKVVFGSIYNLYLSGSKAITLNTILDYLANRPKNEAIFTKQKGSEWLVKVAENANLSAFDYYYNRMKKMTLLRTYDSYGVDVTDIYDPDNILDIKKKELQENQLDNMNLLQIADKIDKKIEAVKATCIGNDAEEEYQAGDSIFELLEDLSKHPEVGIPLYGPLINAVTKGARLKKFYLRSAPTGIGKTRSMIADACYIGCNKIYDPVFGWIRTGISQPTLYITTEQELGEIQTMMLAFLANVPEDHILNTSLYVGDEPERVREAANILKDSKIYIKILPDFSLQDIENTIKQNIREHNVQYIFHDYIHTSLKILEEITQRSGGVRLREDNILFMLSIKLKDICNKYNVFIMSATQLSAEYQDAETPDQNLLRGAKSIADKIDYGSILLPVKQADLDKLQDILSLNAFENPTLKLSVYKNRRGKYKGIYLWCKADLSTCRIKPMFATGWDYGIIDMVDLKIKVEEDGAFQID